jgi:hypothetical protein
LENAAERQAGDTATPRIAITAPPTVDVDDGARHAALLAANAARNAANAARRAELVERVRAIAERRASELTSTRPRSAGVNPRWPHCWPTAPAAPHDPPPYLPSGLA